ncbi:MAG TPA: VWA domain-containing protein [Acidobacteriota bacterium]|nr:VWA domain-containing protein [Acidobacteriota bacterium]
MTGKTYLFSLVLLVCAVLVSNVLAQEDAVRPQRIKETEFRKYVAINYILLDVIITDRDGNYVRNLTKDDFEIFENGRKIRIESIDEYQIIDAGLEDAEALQAGMQPELQPMQQPPRSIIILFDLFYSSTYGVKRAVETAEEFVRDRIQPGDNVMVLSYFGGLRTIQPFTNDKFKIIKSMREMGLATDLLNARGEPASGRDLAENTPMFSDLTHEIGEVEGGNLTDVLNLEASRNAVNYLLSLQALAKAMKYQPGRKTVILLSEGINFDLIDPMSINLKDYGPGSRAFSNADRSGFLVSHLSDYKNMIEALNDAKTSLYTINVGGLSAPGYADMRLAEMDTLSQQADFNQSNYNRNQRQNFLSSISQETGGRAYFNANNLLALLNRIDVDISNYYILGYRTSFDPKRSEYRKISVKATRPGLKILARKGFYTSRPFESLDKDERELHLTEGFLSRSSINDLDARVGFELVRPTTEELNAITCLQVPFERLSLDKGKLDFEVLASNLDDDNKIFSSVHKLYSLNQAELSNLEGKNLRIVESLVSKVGLNRIRIALRDNHSGKRSYFYFNYRFIPEESDDSLLLSQPLFFNSDDKSRSVDEFGLKVEKLRTWNENPPGGYDYLSHPTEGAFFPLVNPTYQQGDTVNFLVVLRNLQDESMREMEPRFEFALSPVQGESTQREYYRFNPIQYMYGLRTNGLVLLASFRIGDFDPGFYDVVVTASESETKRRTASVARLRLEVEEAQPDN